LVPHLGELARSGTVCTSVRSGERLRVRLGPTLAGSARARAPSQTWRDHDRAQKTVLAAATLPRPAARGMLRAVWTRKTANLARFWSNLQRKRAPRTSHPPTAERPRPLPCSATTGPGEVRNAG
jgi:hypothetical protein